MLQGRTSGFASNSATGVLQQWRRASRSTTDNFHHRTRRLRLFSLYKLKSGDRIESSKKEDSNWSSKLARVTSDIRASPNKTKFLCFSSSLWKHFFFKLENCYLLSALPPYVPMVVTYYHVLFLVVIPDYEKKMNITRVICKLSLLTPVILDYVNTDVKEIIQI